MVANRQEGAWILKCSRHNSLFSFFFIAPLFDCLQPASIGTRRRLPCRAVDSNGPRCPWAHSLGELFSTYDMEILEPILLMLPCISPLSTLLRRPSFITLVKWLVTSLTVCISNQRSWVVSAFTMTTASRFPKLQSVMWLSTGDDWWCLLRRVPVCVRVGCSLYISNSDSDLQAQLFPPRRVCKSLFYLLRHVLVFTSCT